MASPSETMKKFLDDVLAKLPEDQREAVRASYSAAHDALDAERVALQTQREEQTSKEGRLEAWRGELRAWATGKEADYAAREKALTEKGVPPATPPETGEKKEGVVDASQIAAQFEALSRNTVAFSNDVTYLMQRHQQLYGGTKLFELEELLRHPKINELGLRGAYDDLHKTQIEAKATEAKNKEIEQIRTQVREELIKEMGPRQPLPFPVGGEDNSPFAILARRTDKDDHSVEAAVQDYRTLTAARTV